MSAFVNPNIFRTYAPERLLPESYQECKLKNLKGLSLDKKTKHLYNSAMIGELIQFEGSILYPLLSFNLERTIAGLPITISYDGH